MLPVGHTTNIVSIILGVPAILRRSPDASLGGCAMIRRKPKPTVVNHLNQMGYQADIMRPVLGASALKDL